MTKKEKYKTLIQFFETTMPVVETELIYNSPFELLVAVVLSAQCTDKRVNTVTPKLFNNYPTPEAMSLASVEDIFNLIRSISYPNSKAKHLTLTAKLLVQNFNSVIPSSIEELTTLPGVGRKTANVIASVIFNMPTMAVDTHVFRVSNRIGLVSKATTPLAVEKQLVKFLPEDIIPKAHHWLILHGRYTCLARTPKCNGCGLVNICKHYKKIKIK